MFTWQSLSHLSPLSHGRSVRRLPLPYEEGERLLGVPASHVADLWERQMQGDVEVCL